jgi:hypothetical protein
VGKGDDTLSGAAGEVGQGALVMKMISGPAVSASLGVGAFATIVAQVFAVARQAVGERG